MDIAQGPVKTFLPLESDPSHFTKFAHSLGLSSTLEFQDVYSISEPSLLDMTPRPALALILVGPFIDVGKTEMPEDRSGSEAYSLSGDEEDVIWFKQTIRNACGLYAILHSISNGAARKFISMCNYPSRTHVRLFTVLHST